MRLIKYSIAFHAMENVCAVVTCACIIPVVSYFALVINSVFLKLKEYIRTWPWDRSNRRPHSFVPHRCIDLNWFDYGLFLMSSAVRLWVAGGFVRVFRWAFVARNEGQSCEKNESFSIALALSRVTVQCNSKNRLANI